MNTSVLPPALVDVPDPKKKDTSSPTGSSVNGNNNSSGSPVDLWNLEISDLMELPSTPSFKRAASAGHEPSKRTTPDSQSSKQQLNTRLLPPALIDASGSTASTTKSTRKADTTADFWNIDLSDLMEAPPSTPAFHRSTSHDAVKTTPREGRESNHGARGAPAKRGINRSKSSDDAPIRLRSALKTSSSSSAARSAPAQRRARRNKSGDDMPVVRGREERSKSPIRIPTFGRSKTRSNSRPRTSTEDGATLRRTVSFDKVQVREFQQILGDNPCKHGPSLALGWNYNEKKGMDLDKYESKRNGNSSVFGLLGGAASSSKRKDLTLSPERRAEKLLDWGFTPEEIAENTKQNEIIRKQRMKSAKEDRLLVNDGFTFDPQAFLKAARVAHGFA